MIFLRRILPSFSSFSPNIHSFRNHARKCAAMSLPPPPPGIDLTASKQPAIIGSIVATWAFAVIAVALRFFARRVSRAGFWWDDWLMLPALVIDVTDSSSPARLD